MDHIDPILELITGEKEREYETIQYTPVRCWNCNKLIGYVSTQGRDEVLNAEFIYNKIECVKCGNSFIKGE